MRSSWAAGVLVVAAAAGAARAEVPADYPTALVDRPIVDPDGMSEASASYSANSFDANLLGFNVSHAFGIVQPSVGLTMPAPRTPNGVSWLHGVTAGVEIATDPHGAVSISGAMYPLSGSRWYVASASYARKAVLMPHSVAAYGYAGLFYQTYTGPGAVDGMIETIHDRRFGADAHAQIELQMGARAVLIFGTTASGSIANNAASPAFPWRDDLELTLMYALDRVDLDAGFTIIDITREPGGEAFVGASARF